MSSLAGISAGRSSRRSNANTSVIERETKEQAIMLLHQLPEQHKREVNIPSTDPPQGFHRIGDLAKSVTKRAILRGYAHGVLSIAVTRSLIDALDLRGA